MVGYNHRSCVLLVVSVLLSQAPCSALNLGINLAGNAYYGNVAYYFDVFMQAAGNSGPWDVNDAGANGVTSLLDATGAPVATPYANGMSTQVWTGFTQYFPAGNYTLTWTGTGGSFRFSVGQLSTTNSTTDSNGTQHNTAILTLPGPPPNAVAGADNSWVYVTATLPFSNCHLLSPREFAVPYSVFRSDYLATLKPFSTFRFMDFLATNGNSVKDWSQRTLPVGSRVGRPQGIAYEDIVDLATATGKDVWINIPAHATDDYVCRVARFFAFGELGPASNPNAPCVPNASATGPFTYTMPSKQTIYLEYSNEVWNYGFSQVGDNLCMANNGNVSGKVCAFSTPFSVIAAAALANTSLPWTTSIDNVYGRAQQLTFVLAKRCVDIFRAAFRAAGSKAPRLHTVLNVQAAYYNSYYYAYPFFEQGFGPLNGTFDSFAIAPYLDLADDNAEVSLEQIIANLTAAVNTTNRNMIQQDLDFFNSKGVSMIAYEGGQGLNGIVSVDNKVAAQFDPRMYTITQQYLKVWEEVVGPNALFNYFTYAGNDGQYGSWGALTSSKEHGSQKWDAMMSLRLQPGDATMDGQVDQNDCLAMAAAYNPSGAVATSNRSTWNVWWRDGDFDHNGVVNAADLALLNAHVSAGFPSPICVANGNTLSASGTPPTSSPVSAPILPAPPTPSPTGAPTSPPTAPTSKTSNSTTPTSNSTTLTTNASPAGAPTLFSVALIALAVFKAM